MFRAEIPTHVIYLRTSKFLSPLIRQHLKPAGKSLKELLPPVFNGWFKFSFESPFMILDGVIKLGYLTIFSYQTKTYGRYSMILSAINGWN